MYSALSWVPRGVSSSKPIRAIPTAAEIEEYKKVLKEQNQLGALQQMEEMESNATGEDTNIRGILGDSVDIDSLDPTKDPNITLKEEEWDSDNDDDLDIMPTDCILMAAKSDEDQSSLEFHVYDETTGNFYLHHDILLAAFPLSLAWMDFVPQPLDSLNGHPSGSFVAVGTFHPEIEIWNTNLIDSMEPECVLGGLVDGKKRTLKPGSHRQAVMGLSWNQIYRNVLASSSADTTVKLWDLSTQKCMMTLNQHKDKIPVVQFHPIEANILLTASYDGVCAVTDGRSPQNGTWVGLPCKPESATWNQHAPYTFFVSTENGDILGYDIRQTEKPVINQIIHQGPCTAISVNPLVPQLIATAGEDGFVRLWNQQADHLEMVAERNVNLGNVFGCSFYESSPYLIGACGSSTDLCLWDVREVEKLSGMFDNKEQVQFGEKLVFEASESATGTLNDIQKKKKH